MAKGTIVRPAYSGSYTDIAEILQGEFGITKSDDSKPVLATYGIGPCVAIVGYSKKDKIGFLTHCDRATSSGESIDILLDSLLKLLDGKNSEFEVRLIGGEDLANELLDVIKSIKNVKLKIVEEDTGKKGIRDVALDTRDGKVYSYNIRLNPNSRELILDFYSILTPSYVLRRINQSSDIVSSCVLT